MEPITIEFLLYNFIIGGAIGFVSWYFKKKIFWIAQLVGFIIVIYQLWPYMNPSEILQAQGSEITSQGANAIQKIFEILIPYVVGEAAGKKGEAIFFETKRSE